VSCVGSHPHDHCFQRKQDNCYAHWKIVKGDAEKLRAIIQSANEAGRLVSGIRLTHPAATFLKREAGEHYPISKNLYGCCERSEVRIRMFIAFAAVPEIC